MSCFNAMAAECPIHSVTALMGRCSSKSVSQLARKVWNSRGHVFNPARRINFSNVVRMLALIHPFGPY